ncbi:adenosylmethionine decarboxylase [Ruegeria arenilitoris]|uniref:adenosylmethionine decarboxylase n=1 Tax=Ruegeria arenilitoris TaxID=1173585 RepID=UPI001480F13A|nr:adenosylmethionine decarboxylase [Ruegeria arenilitoris]
MDGSSSSLGIHLIADFFDASALYDPVPAEDALRRAAVAAKAHVLGVNTHDFGQRAGFTGVALLAESHISVHTWPEHGYAALDIFMCGDAKPQLSLDVLKSYFRPQRVNVQSIRRGLIGHATPRLAVAGF